MFWDILEAICDAASRYQNWLVVGGDGVSWTQSMVNGVFNNLDNNKPNIDGILFDVEDVANAQDWPTVASTIQSNSSSYSRAMTVDAKDLMLSGKSPSYQDIRGGSGGCESYKTFLCGGTCPSYPIPRGGFVSPMVYGGAGQLGCPQDTSATATAAITQEQSDGFGYSTDPTNCGFGHGSGSPSTIIEGLLDPLQSGLPQALAQGAPITSFPLSVQVKAPLGGNYCPVSNLDWTLAFGGFIAWNGTTGNGSLPL